MLYVEVQEASSGHSLKHYCKFCKFSQEAEKGAKSMLISDKNHFNASENAYKNYMTPFIRYDTTLPRVNNIKCVNGKCDAPQNEVIYIKYDSENMKYLYHCCHCGHFWKLS
jgi:DNA-directed RNA polymerase subunit M/transcription elongation factor TFIIS